MSPAGGEQRGLFQIYVDPDYASDSEALGRQEYTGVLRSLICR
jgi:hypothetical protein